MRIPRRPPPPRVDDARHHHAAGLRDAVLDPRTAPDPVLSDAPAYAEVAPRLIVHLYRADTIGEARDRIVARPLCDGLVSALAVDLGNAIASLPVDLPARWGRSEDELFRVGLGNVERRRVRRESFPTGNLPGVVVSGDHHSVTSQVHFLNNHLGRRYPAGAIVGLPARSMLFAIPLRTGADADAMERLTRAVTAGLDLLDGVASDPAFADQRFSPDLYWWCDGELRRLPAGRTPAGPAVMPPDEMVAALLARTAERRGSVTRARCR